MKIAEIKGKAKGYKREADTLKLSLQVETQKSSNKLKELKALMQEVV